jgi:hypothetical protein
MAYSHYFCPRSRHVASRPTCQSPRNNLSLYPPRSHDIAWRGTVRYSLHSCRVGGGAPHGANLRPPLKLHVQFSRMQLSRRRARAGRKGRSKLDPVPQHPTWSPKEWTFLAAVGLSQSASLLDRECTGLSPWNCSSFSTLLFWFAFPSRPSDAGRLPRPIPVADWLGHAAFTALVVPLQPSDYWPSIARHFARGLIGSLTAGQPADSASPPEVTGNSSVPCRPHTPWYGG